MGNTVLKSFNGGKLAAKDYIDRIILLLKKFDPRGLSAPAPGYIHVHNHYFQTTSSLKSEISWPINAKFSCGAFLGRDNESLYKWSRSHDQDGRHAYMW